MSRYLITTISTISICRCGALTITGHAEGIPIRLDPIPLSPLGALHTILAGRPTFVLARHGIVHRTAERIGDPRLKGPTVTRHQCHHPPPVEYREHTSAVETAAPPDPERIPY